MQEIPLYILEEHHEAYLAWCIERRSARLGGGPCSLLHLDHHSDMGCPILGASILSAPEDLGGLADFVYEELGIGSFIVPALYLGFFQEVAWAHYQEGEPPVESKRQVRTYKGQGRVFLTEPDYSPWPRESPWDDRSPFLYRAGRIVDLLAPDSTPVLDIDLDYFACSPMDGPPSVRLEITREQYDRIRHDRYHPIRLRGTHRLRIEDGRCYLCERRLPARTDPSPAETRATIEARLDEMAAALAANRVQPIMIDVCRSRISGYTPPEHADFIEAGLLERLARLYPIRLIDLNGCGVATA